MRYWTVLIVAALAGASVRATLQPAPAQSVRARVTPPATTPEARGRLVYTSYGCPLCHGDEGKGGFQNPNAETDGKVPAVTYVAEGYTPAELAKLVRAGAPRIGRADPNGPLPPYRMPGWGDLMTDEEVADLVRYLLSLLPRDAGSSWR